MRKIFTFHKMSRKFDFPMVIYSICTRIENNNNESEREQKEISLNTKKGTRVDVYF